MVYLCNVLILQKEYLCTSKVAIWYTLAGRQEDVSTCEPKHKEWLSMQCSIPSDLTSLTTRAEKSALQALYEKTSL